MIRVLVRNPELQRKSQSYSPKVRITPGWTPKSGPNRPKHVSDLDIGSSAEKVLKTFLNPPKLYSIWPALSQGMDWRRMERAWSRVRATFVRGRHLQENP